MLNNANLARLINSDEVQSVVRPKQRITTLHFRQRKNPLKNKALMNRLNPFDRVRKEQETKQATANVQNKAANAKTKRDNAKKHRKAGRRFIRNFREGVAGANQVSEIDYKNYIKSIKIGEDAMKDKDNQ